MTKRKFYKTIVPLEILSEEPIGVMTPEQIIAEATDGCFSMRILPVEETELDGEQAAAALGNQGSDPSFFNLTRHGEDADV